MGDPMDRHWHPLLIAVLLLTAVAAGCTKSTTSRTAAPSASNRASTTAAGASRLAPPWVVGVTLKEFALTPTVTIAHAGPVTFDARNLGKIKHELVVLRRIRAHERDWGFCTAAHAAIRHLQTEHVVVERNHSIGLENIDTDVTKLRTHRHRRSPLLIAV